MKLAFVYDNSGSRPIRKNDGNLTSFPAFRWLVKSRLGKSWRIDLLAYCSMTTENFKFQVFQGVLAFGRTEQELFIELCPNERVYHMGVRYVKRRNM